MDTSFDLLFAIALLVGLVVFDLLAVRFGVDSRPGFDGRPI